MDNLRLVSISWFVRDQSENARKRKVGDCRGSRRKTRTGKCLVGFLRLQSFVKAKNDESKLVFVLARLGVRLQLDWHVPFALHEDRHFLEFDPISIFLGMWHHWLQNFRTRSHPKSVKLTEKRHF